MRIDPLEALTSGQAKLWMVLTGINDYGDRHFPALRYAMADCMKFAAALEMATESFPVKETIVHCQTEHPLTLATIRANLQRVAEQAGVNDIILFYWAGHGFVPAMGQPLYLCLPETCFEQLSETALSLLEVLNTLKQCRASKQVMILDACHSGNLSLDRRGGLQSRNSLEDPVSEQQTQSAIELKQVLEQYASSQQDFYALLSCDRGQRSWESAQLHHGVFTYFLIEGVKGKASDSSGVINTLDLFRYVYNETRWYVGSVNQEQTPCQIIRSASGELVIGLAERSKDFNERYAEHLRDYEQSFVRALCQHYPLQEEDRQELQKLQQTWLLTPNDVQQREERITHACERCQQEIQERLLSQDLLNIQEEQLSLHSLHRLYSLNRELIDSILRTVVEEQEPSRLQYEKEVGDLIRQYYPDHEHLLQQVQQKLNLTPQNVASTTASLIADYEAIVTAYRQEVIDRVAQYPQIEEASSGDLLVDDTSLNDCLINVFRTNQVRPNGSRTPVNDNSFQESVIIQLLQQLGQDRGLRDEVMLPILQQVLATHKTKLNDYQQKAANMIAQHHPDDAGVDQQLRAIQGDLQDSVVAVINQALRTEHQRRVDRYQQRVKTVINQRYPLNREALIASCQRIAEEENVTDKVASELNDRLIQDYIDITHQYKAIVFSTVHANYPLNMVALRSLRQQRDRLGLTQDVAVAIEDEVYMDYEQKESRYQGAIAGHIQQAYPLSTEAKAQLKELQQTLGLSDAIAQRLQQKSSQGYQETLDRYEASFVNLISHHYPLTQADRQQLEVLQQQLPLTTDVAAAIEHRILQSYEPKLQRYEQGINDRVHDRYPLEGEDYEQLNALKVSLQLSDEIAAFLESQVTHAYEQKLQAYERLATDLIRQTYPLDELAQQQLQAKQTELKLNDDLARLIRDRVTETYQNRLKAYEQQLKRLLNP